MSATRHVSQRLLGFAALVVASWLLARQRGGACPYRLRFVLSIPRPSIGRARLAETLHAQPGERILEIGPGNGHYTSSLATWVGPEGKVDIFDLQQKFLDQTMCVVTEAGLPNVHPTRGDARTLPYENNSFDAVVLIGVLGEIPDQQLALHEIARVLKPGGRLLVGESILDPDYAFFNSLRRRTTDTGLLFDSRQGHVAGYYARFTKPQPSLTPA